MKFDQLQTAPSFEKLKETYKNRLDGILHKSLTVENIETFADEALDDLVALTDDILKQYRSNSSFNPNKPDPLFSNQEQENDAFHKLDLPNIQEILQRVIEVKDQITDLKIYLDQNVDGVGKIIIPPQQNTGAEIKTGSGQGIEEKKFIPRLLTLLYILEADFDIKKEQVKIIEGKVTPDMMRKTPYMRVEIPDMERIVYICDEEGNASYVLDAEKLNEAGISAENLDTENKGSMNDLISKHPGIGARITQTQHWRTNMAELLGNSIPEKTLEKKLAIIEKLKQPISEFIKKERKKWTFEALQVDVRDPKKNIKSSEDYLRNVSKNKWPSHKTLTSMPEFPKKPDGSNDWNAFLGKEKWTLKTLQVDVRDPKKNIKSSEDYEDNAQKNKWPSNKTLTSMPEFPKKPDGSNDWNAFLGKEKFDFEKFRQKVIKEGIKSSFEYAKNIYKKKRPSHKTLTSMPEFPKKPDGSNDWNAFLGKEKFDFEKFRQKVIKEGIKSSREYYVNAPQKKWPANITLTSMPEFPKNPDGSNDWNTFLGRNK